MKKVLIANDVKDLLLAKNNFLGRLEVAIFTAATNDELLEVHRQEKGTLIITQLETPGISCEELIRVIRADNDLKRASIILISKDTLAHRERSRHCGANVVFTLPVDMALLNVKIHQLLNVSPRKTYRVALAVAIQDKFKNRPMPFWTENISASGMLIRAEEPLAKGEGIFFSFFLPDGSHASGYGEIARVVRLTDPPESFLYGIRFTDIAPGVRRAIEAAVEGQ